MAMEGSNSKFSWPYFIKGVEKMQSRLLEWFKVINKTPRHSQELIYHSVCCTFWRSPTSGCKGVEDDDGNGNLVTLEKYWSVFSHPISEELLLCNISLYDILILLASGVSVITFICLDCRKVNAQRLHLHVHTVLHV
jgi:hypothetical protein